MPSLKEHWDILCKNLPSPNSYIDFGFYYLIGAALQRRVWFSEPPWQIFPNQYIVLVGPPSTGKGIVIGLVTRLLKHHKREAGATIRTNIGEEKPLLFHTGADCITFEQLLAKLASRADRLITPDKKPYFHSSMWFALEELASLFKIKTEDVVKFLQSAYDCKDYDYEIKHQDRKDHVRNICLCILAGTQFDFLQKAQRMDIFGQGWSSRTVFIFENKPRFIRFHLAETFDEEQITAQATILEHIKKLSTIFGRLTYNSECNEFLEDWFLNHHTPRAERASPKMQEYLGRMRTHVMKMAAAIHFSGENLGLTISLVEIKQAIEILNSIGTNIEAGLALIGKNPLHVTTKSMLAFIKERKEVMESDLILAFLSEINMDEFKLCMKELELGYGLKVKLKANGKNVYYL